MTTITYRDNCMAADSSSWIGGTQASGARKIHRVRGSLIGCAGTLTDIMAFIKWVKDGGHEDEFPRMRDLSAIVVDATGRVKAFEHDTPAPMMMIGRYFSIGSGMDVALGAMHAGATAVGAIKAAIAHDEHTRGPVKTARLSV